MQEINSLSKNKYFPFVSVLIVNFNGKHFLERCLPSVFQSNYPFKRYEVIVVDNGSTDGSVEYVKREFPQVKVVNLDKNYGFAIANNKGVEIAKGELIVFLNNDTIVNKDWLCELVKVMMSDEKIAICGGRILFMNGKTQYSVGYLHSLGGIIYYPFNDNELIRDYYFVGSILGAFFGVRRKIFEILGGFDKDFFLYGEEVDLCWRAWNFGHKCVVATKSIIHHYSGGSADKIQTFFSKYSKSKFRSIIYGRLTSHVKIYHECINSLVMLIKNLQTKNLLKSVLFYYLYLLFQLLLLLYIKSGAVKLIIKASIWPLKNLKSVWIKRLSTQFKRKVNDDWLLKNGLLLSLSKTLKLAMLSRDNIA